MSARWAETLDKSAAFLIEERGIPRVLAKVWQCKGRCGWAFYDASGLLGGGYVDELDQAMSAAREALTEFRIL